MSVEQGLVLRLSPTPPACRSARRAVSEFCRGHGLDHLVDDAALLTTELVTNAIRHAAALVTVVASRHADALVVEVTGDGRGRVPSSPTLPPADAESGRGLCVVAHVAQSWGSSSDNGAMTVWFRLA